MEKNILINELSEIKFSLKLENKPITHTFITGKVGEGMTYSYYQIFSNITMKINGIKDFPFKNELIKKVYLDGLSGR